jgi:site-specific DNA-adenine methylase
MVQGDVMLRPFFSYFGSKYRLGKFYPEPKYDTIIEPFAGAAGYSLRYPHKKVMLYDNYEPVVALWEYLFKVEEEEILAMPLDNKGFAFCKEHPIDDCDIAPEAKTLLGFWLTESQTYASRYPLSKSRGGAWSERKRTLIASQLEHIRHWRVEHKSYEEIDSNQECTWFVDPPYCQAGKRYVRSAIDYQHLGEWCKNRQGQTIVCEQNGADWLDFSVLKKTTNASNKEYKEVVWINSDWRVS